MKRLAALLLFLLAAVASAQTAPYILTQTLGTVRNDFPGYVGFYFSTGVNTPTVNALCRWKIAGNAQNHALYLYKYVDGGAGDLLIVAASLNLSSGVAGQYNCVAITPTLLATGTTYYVISQEFNGGDQFYDNDSTADTFSPSVGTYGGAASLDALNNATLTPGSTIFGPTNVLVAAAPVLTPTPTAAATPTPTSPPCPSAPSQNMRRVGAGTYQATRDDGLIFADPSLGAVTVLLPANPAMCSRLVIKRMPGIYNVVVDGNGKRIDGQPTRTMRTVNSAIKIVFQPLFHWGVI